MEFNSFYQHVDFLLATHQYNMTWQRNSMLNTDQPKQTQILYEVVIEDSIKINSCYKRMI